MMFTQRQYFVSGPGGVTFSDIARAKTASIYNCGAREHVFGSANTYRTHFIEQQALKTKINKYGKMGQLTTHMGHMEVQA